MSIQYTDRDSNPQPLEHESPPITTRPGLLPSWGSFDYLFSALCTAQIRSYDKLKLLVHLAILFPDWEV